MKYNADKRADLMVDWVLDPEKGGQKFETDDMNAYN
jgi:hypothetical protein